MKLKLLCLTAATVAVMGYTNATTITYAHFELSENTLLNTSVSNMNGPAVSKDQTSNFYSEKNSKHDSHSVGMVEYAVTGPIQRVRLRFSAEDGLKRPLLLGFTPDNAASDGFDYGYDALPADQYPNDMFWNIEGKSYIIQGVGAFDDLKAYPLHINITNPGLIKIDLTDLENFNSEIDVFLFDSDLNSYTKINSATYEKTLDAGVYENRFFIAFASDVAPSALSTSEEQNQKPLVNYLTNSSDLLIKMNDLQNIKAVKLINVIGREIKTWEKGDFNISDAIRIPVKNIPKGTYIVTVITDSSTINKKIIIR